VTSDLYQLLQCPACGAAPRPADARCPGCGRRIVAANGGLDLLDDEAREAADRFAIDYAALRRREGWMGPGGREDPAGGDPRLWRQRVESVSEARAAIATMPSGEQRPVVVDVGSGGGWAARYLGDADVIAIDLLDVADSPAALQVRGDMRRLPLHDGSVDGALYIASLHYAPLEQAVAEAARVLRRGGVMIAVDSPMYRDRLAQARALARSAAYYAGAGFPNLAAHYHPIDLTELKARMVASGFKVLRLEGGSTAARWYQRVGRRRRPSFLLAKSKAG
jgi:SAM-dependent methyltransferase